MNYRNAVNICFFINGFIFANWAARIPRILEDFGLDNKSLGFVLLAHSIGAFIAMPISGWLIIKNGSKLTTAVSSLLFCVFFMSIPLAPSIWLLMIPFALMGASTGVMDVAMNAQAVVVEGELKKPIMSFFHGIFSIGMVAGGVCGSMFAKGNVSLTMHFLLIGLISLIIFAINQFFLHPDKRSKQASQKFMLIWPSGAIILLGLIAFCCMLGEGAMSDWSAIYLKTSFGTSEYLAAFGLIAFAFMMTLGRLIGDRGRVIWSDKALMQVCAIISLAGISMILLKPGIILTITGFGLVGLGLSIIVPIVYSLAGSFPGLSPGVGIAMSTTIGYAGFMIGPPVIGFIADAFDLQIAMGFVGVLFLAMTILVFNLKKKKG